MISRRRWAVGRWLLPSSGYYFMWVRTWAMRPISAIVAGEFLCRPRFKCCSATPSRRTKWGLFYLRDYILRRHSSLLLKVERRLTMVHSRWWCCFLKTTVQDLSNAPLRWGRDIATTGFCWSSGTESYDVGAVFSAEGLYCSDCVEVEVTFIRAITAGALLERVNRSLAIAGWGRRRWTFRSHPLSLEVGSLSLLLPGLVKPF